MLPGNLQSPSCRSPSLGLASQQGYFTFPQQGGGGAGGLRWRWEGERKWMFLENLNWSKLNFGRYLGDVRGGGSGHSIS